MKCDVCRDDIVGPRFECIHCPSFNCCASCEIKLSDGIHPINHVMIVDLQGGNSNDNGGRRK